MNNFQIKDRIDYIKDLPSDSIDFVKLKFYEEIISAIATGELELQSARYACSLIKSKLIHGTAMNSAGIEPARLSP